MEKLKSVGQIFAGLAVATLFFLLGGVRTLLDFIGYSTSADDAALLRSRLPIALSWLPNMPWWVAALTMLAGVMLSTWLIVSGTKMLVSQQRLKVELPEGTITAAQAAQLLDWAWWFRDDYEKAKPGFIQRMDALTHQVSEVRSDNVTALANLRADVYSALNALKENFVAKAVEGINPAIVSVKDDLFVKFRGDRLDFRDAISGQFGGVVQNVEMLTGLFADINNLRQDIERLTYLTESVQLRLPPGDAERETQP